jgi:DNA repair exonuclease SbcCD ATPase subunit
MKNRCLELDIKKIDLEKQIKMIEINKENIVTFDLGDLINLNKLLLEKKKELKQKINNDLILYEDISKENLSKSIKINLNKISKFKSSLSNNVYNEELYENTQLKYNDLIEEFKLNISRIKKNTYKIKKLKSTLYTLDNNIVEMYELKKELTNKQLLLKKLNKHKFSKKCKFCMSNELTQQKINLLNEIKIINKKLGVTVDSANTVNLIESKYNKYIKHKELNEKKFNQINLIQNENEKLKNHNMTIETLNTEYLIILNTKKSFIKNCKINQKIKELNDQNNIYIKNKQKLLNLNYLIKVNTDELIKTNLELKQNKYIYLNQLDILNKTDKGDKIFINNITKRNILIKNLDEINEEIIKTKVDFKYIEDCKKIQEMSCNEYEEYELISQSIKGEKGIYNDIFNNGCIEIINKMTNNILKDFNMFQIQIKIERDELYILKKDGTNVTQFSTSETNIFNIIFRCVLNSITKKFSSSVLIIDEIFDGLEMKNKLKCIELIENIKKIYPKIIIISHDELIKNMCDKIINIGYKDGYSFII